MDAEWSSVNVPPGRVPGGQSRTQTRKIEEIAADMACILSSMLHGFRFDDKFIWICFYCTQIKKTCLTFLLATYAIVYKHLVWSFTIYKADGRTLQQKTMQLFITLPIFAACIFGIAAGHNFRGTWDSGEAEVPTSRPTSQPTQDEGEGNIPGELGNLSSLSSLYLVDNSLTGTIPSELENLANMQPTQDEGNIQPTTCFTCNDEAA